jgi:hypothetical protein
MIQVFFPSIVVNENVIHITTTKLLVNGHRILSIILMKVVGAFVKPKGIKNHSKFPSVDFKVVLHTSVCFIEIWW